MENTESSGPMQRISCLGPVGSYSELAAKRMCPDAEVILCHSFTDAVRKLMAGETDGAVLPVENSLNGGVLECLDLLEEQDIFAREEFPLPVDHRLAVLEGVKYEDIKRIYSHEQALGQCANFLERNFPDAEYVGTASTVESLGSLDKCSAGIVGSHIEREGVVLSKENIADRGNFTRFLLLERAGKLPERSAMVFLAAVCAHRPGSLLGLLKIFQRYSLNLTRIESRPVKGAFGQYRFFIEFAGNLAEERVKAAIKEAGAYCDQFKLLGAYG